MPARSALWSALPQGERVTLWWRQLGLDVRSIVVVGAPLIINNLSSIGVGVADTMMAARLGSQQLAGVAIGNGMWIALFLLGLGTLMALGPTVAQHFGAGRDDEIGHDTRQGLWLAVLISPASTRRPCAVSVRNCR